jgi:hypothetical protein
MTADASSLLARQAVTNPEGNERTTNVESFQEVNCNELQQLVGGASLATQLNPAV